VGVSLSEIGVSSQRVSELRGQRCRLKRRSKIAQIRRSEESASLLPARHLLRDPFGIGEVGIGNGAHSVGMLSLVGS
jgi:hypothetical protein